MQIEVYPSFGKILDSRISGSTVIVIDVLRSTTSITWAVKNGASKVIPASDPGEAAEIYGRIDAADCVLAGETGSIKFPDFDLGNSPVEFSEDIVRDKTIIVSTSNGTAAIHGVKGAKCVLIGAMINRTAVARRALELGNDIIIVCAGTEGQISADDLCAAGAILCAIDSCAAEQVESDDVAFVCRTLFRDWKDGKLDMDKTKHWNKLQALGLSEDIKFCFTLDATDVVPEYANGIIS